jgi:HEPN domain-containing protein
MKKQVEDWILLADRDLKVSELLMREEEPITTIVAFHCQQTIEKYLKAYMIEKDMPLNKCRNL